MSRSPERMSRWVWLGIEILLILGFFLYMAGLAPPAEPQECLVHTIEDGIITERSGVVPDLHTALVGQFLWVNIGELETDADLGVGSISHEVGDNGVATVCPDGSVSFVETQGETAVPNEPDPMTVDVVVDEIQPLIVIPVVHFTGGFQVF